MIFSKNRVKTLKMICCTSSYKSCVRGNNKDFINEIQVSWGHNHQNNSLISEPSHCSHEWPVGHCFSSLLCDQNNGRGLTTYSHHYLHISLQITGPVLLINYCSITGQAFCGHTHVPRPRVAEYWTCFLVNTHKHMFFRGGTMSGQNVNLIDTKEYYEINIFNDHLFLPIPLSSMCSAGF